jgi:hypothetical protein
MYRELHEFLSGLEADTAGDSPLPHILEVVLRNVASSFADLKTFKHKLVYAWSWLWTFGFDSIDLQEGPNCEPYLIYLMRVHFLSKFNAVERDYESIQIDTTNLNLSDWISQTRIHLYVNTSRLLALFLYHQARYLIHVISNAPHVAVLDTGEIAIVPAIAQNGDVFAELYDRNTNIVLFPVRSVRDQALEAEILDELRADVTWRSEHVSKQYPSFLDSPWNPYRHPMPEEGKLVVKTVGNYQMISAFRTPPFGDMESRGFDAQYNSPRSQSHHPRSRDHSYTLNSSRLLGCKRAADMNATIARESPPHSPIHGPRASSHKEREITYGRVTQPRKSQDITTIQHVPTSLASNITSRHKICEQTGGTTNRSRTQSCHKQTHPTPAC